MYGLALISIQRRTDIITKEVNTAYFRMYGLALVSFNRSTDINTEVVIDIFASKKAKRQNSI